MMPAGRSGATGEPIPVTFGSVTSASGVGVATIAADGTILDAWFPEPELSGDGVTGGQERSDSGVVTGGEERSDSGVVTGTNRLSVAEVTEELAALTGRDDERDVETVIVRTTIAS